jgi:hypothetical protein
MKQNSPFVQNQAREDFNKARSKATLSQLLNALTPDRQELLSLEDVRTLLNPRKESYVGMKTVDIEKIVGSEGRYKDFNRAFLPKRDFIRGRWESVDRAHLTNRILPPIKLDEIGGVYFVRDGNHRVSVARMQGVEAIDAEVIRLDSEIRIEPGMTVNDLKNAVIAYEKEKVFSETRLDTIIPPEDIEFSEPGRYVEMLRHIQGHKYFLNEGQPQEISFLDAASSWYNSLYKPIIRIIEQEGIMSRFPGRTMSDLYMWIIKHWDSLKQKYGNSFSLDLAALDYSKRYGKDRWKRLIEGFERFLNKLF